MVSKGVNGGGILLLTFQDFRGVVGKICVPYPDKTILKDSPVDLKTPAFPCGPINSQELKGRGWAGERVLPVSG